MGGESGKKERVVVVGRKKGTHEGKTRKEKERGSGKKTTKDGETRVQGKE